MCRLFERTYRGLLQPLLFILFGLGAWILAAVFVLVSWMMPGSAEDKSTFIQRVIQQSFRLFLWLVQTLKVMEFDVQGAEILSRGGAGVVIANHPTLLDVVLLISRLPQADCIVKKGLWENVFLRGIVQAAGYIPNDDGPHLVATALDRIRRGRKVVIFPEGTRSLPHELRPFNNGFAHIAVRAPCLLWPAVITCRPPALSKGRSVFNVPSTRARLTASIREPLNPADSFEASDRAAVAVKKVAADVRHYFDEAVYRDGSYDD